MNIDESRSYQTEERLHKAINKLFPKELVRHALVVCNRKGRFTAVFGKSFVESANIGFVHVAQQGFMVLG